MGRIARTGSSPEKLFNKSIACRQKDGKGTNVLFGESQGFLAAAQKARWAKVKAKQGKK
jgi:hypothetical protein